jgi:hypothetical protein
LAISGNTKTDKKANGKIKPAYYLKTGSYGLIFWLKTNNFYIPQLLI